MSMQFQADTVYHIFNRGNDKQPIFYDDDNYHFFMQKVRRSLTPHCEILAYCLMPNHFHFLIYATESTLKSVIIGGRSKNVMSEAIKNLLSSYTQAFNKKWGKTGSLFQQNTHAQSCDKGQRSYGTVCFHYIHQNPVKAGMVEKLEDWQFSSFNDYLIENKATCNIPLAFEILDICRDTFYEDAYQVIVFDKSYIP